MGDINTVFGRKLIELINVHTPVTPIRSTATNVHIFNTATVRTGRTFTHISFRIQTFKHLTASGTKIKTTQTINKPVKIPIIKIVNKVGSHPTELQIKRFGPVINLSKNIFFILRRAVTPITFSVQLAQQLQIICPICTL